MKQVFNKQPAITTDNRIAIIGEAPSKDDVQLGEPFVGYIGNLLSSLLNNAGILKSACYLGNVVQFNTPRGLASAPTWQEDTGLRDLKADMATYDPNIVVLLGDALKAAGESRSSLKMRGTLFICRDIDSPFYGRKCMGTLAPASVLKKYDWLPLLNLDIQRAAEESKTKELVLPERNFDLDLTANQICAKLDNWKPGHLASIDIEGGVNPDMFGGITCMSIAESPHYAFIIDWKNMRDSVKPMVYDSYKRWMEDPAIPKVAQNAAYEHFCIMWQHKVHVAGLVGDTMLSGWEIYPELPKALGTQLSIWTKEPYYKSERTNQDWQVHLKYCCKDTMGTYELFQAHEKYFEENPEAAVHYEFNMRQLPSLFYMKQRGFKYDTVQAEQLIREYNAEKDELMFQIELLNGCEVNPNSYKQMRKVLYERHKFEKMYVKEKGRKTNKLATDAITLLTLFKKYDSDFIFSVLKWKSKDKILQQLAHQPNDDGRMRANYNIVGTKTGRYSCSTSDSGSGYNLQTTTKDLRKLFVADEGMAMFHVDLAGADGWTVAAHALKLGDGKMYEDYLTGVKPAKTICAMHLTGDKSLANLPSHQLLEVIDSLEIPAWLYDAAKAVQHGSSYGMGKLTMSNNILRQSWKKSGEPFYLSAKDCESLQVLFFKRYKGVLKWQAWVRQQLENKGQLASASGHVRTFFGRRTDNAVIKDAYAQEPQANTTYATSLASCNLWYDKENRRQNGSLIIEPLHQVHDELIGQFPLSQAAESVAKLKHYFTNTITIAGEDLIIPFEGEYGTYWGDGSLGTI